MFSLFNKHLTKHIHPNFKKMEQNLKRKFSSSFTLNSLLKISKESAIIIPSSTETTIYLNNERTSWIRCKQIEPPVGLSMEEFELLWSLKPKERSVVKMWGKVVVCPRYTQTYLQPYTFSGVTHEANLDIPTRIGQLLSIML